MDIDEILKGIKPETIAKLRRIKRFLTEERAAVMVGSGFSKNADMSSSAKMKDWKELIDDIYKEAYGYKPEAEQLHLTSPMKIASVLEANCGKDALDAIIKSSLPDESARPGKLHKMLMELPWADVFTTNYDTLLERAAKETRRYYRLVENKESLLYQQSPRIVKLHGSFPNHHPFIMSEEDFRTYPQKYPEFVNTVRQALIENLFVLIGFSGDDPNFLNWLGWLRDVMGDKTSPLYCITYRDEIPQPEINLYKQRKIDFINLKEIGGLNGIKESFEFFLEFLRQKPESDEWTGGPLSQLRMDNKTTEEMISVMKEKRESYPGWIVLPKGYHSQFEDVVWSLINVNSQLKDDSLSTKVKYLYELDWRLEISLTPKLTDDYEKQLEEVVYSEEELDERLRSMLLKLAISLLGIYRQTNKADEFEKLSNKIKERFSSVYSDEYKRYYYEQGLMALWYHDYEKIDQIDEIWDVSLDDCQGVLWKAMLLNEAGRAKDAYKLLTKSASTISRTILKEGGDTPYLKSGLWQMDKCAQLYKRNFTPIWDQIKEAQKSKIEEVKFRYDFYEIRDMLYQHFMSDKGWSDKEELHSFEIGRSDTYWHSGPGFVPNFRNPIAVLLLHEQAGMPLSASSTHFREMLPFLCKYSFWITSSILLTCGGEVMINKVLRKNMLSVVGREECNTLFDHLLKTWNDYTNEKNAILRIRMHETILPFVVRLSVKVSQDRIIELTKIALKQNEMCRNKYLQTLYNALNEDSIKVLIDRILLAEYQSRQLMLPKVYSKSLAISDETIDSCIEALKEEYSIDAYHRLVTYKGKLSDRQQEKISNAIRKWRSSGDINSTKLESFQHVKYLEGVDLLNPKAIGEEKVNLFCAEAFKIKGDSSSIVKLDHAIREIGMLTEYISNEDRQRVLMHIMDVLKDNEAALKEDDTDELLGGFRKFSNQMMGCVELFVLQEMPNTSKDDLIKVLGVLESYEGNQFRLLNCLIAISRHLGIKDKIDLYTNKVIDKLLSEKKGEAIEALSAAPYLKKTEIQKSHLKRMHNYLRYARRFHAKYVVQMFTVLVCNDRMPKLHYKDTLEVLRIIDDYIETYSINEDEKSDIIYECLILVGLLYERMPELRKKEIVKNWVAYAKNDDIFNDQRKGFAVGRALK